MLTAIVGTNWGDEGKGRMVDLLSARYDIVARYQGGNNAGHTVVNEKGKFILNLLPSGILRDETVNVMGPGMVIDIEHLTKEIQTLRDKGIDITPKHLVISDRATICMPYHKMMDILEEERLADKKFGSTRRGIAPVYADKYMKKTVRMGDLLHPEDTTTYLTEAIKEGKSVMFEAQLGALRDIDFGIYPYTSSSSTIAAYAPIGAGIPAQKLDEVVGIMKAYSSCVGEGPFTCELFGEEGDALREAGGEYGAATGRPRRVGGFDVVASRYGAMMQGATAIALTKLDVLSYLKKIPVCVKYDVDGKQVDNFPVGDALAKAKPVYEYVDGWNEDISGCRKFEDLPVNAQKYVEMIEKAVGCPIKYVSVGAGRDEYIER